ncbi:MAG TPA: aminotransferase class I/II-fold pyridoxal phosphate-dependent enzyme [Candidatus Limnocylindria bacterium]|nr:aminotransferase class I/II-fold pyridoxal phosphate-dependent enzyme [Candidatus Limnocylindria bacterium]
MELYTYISARCEALREDMTLRRIFELSVENTDRVAAHWLEGDEEKNATFGELQAWTGAYAAHLRKAFGEHNVGRFAAIQVDTCKEWFALFWGMVQAGYNPLLLNATLGEEMTEHMLRQAGACGVVARGTKNLPAEFVQADAEEVFRAQPDPGFAPRWAGKVALCTSGSTATSRIFVYDEAALCEQVLNSDLLHKANPRIVNNRMQRNLAFLPFHHVFGFLVCIMWCNFIGYETVFLKDRAPETVLGTMRRFKVNFLCAVPLLANSLSAGLNKKVAQEKPVKRAVFKIMKGISLGLQNVAPGFGMDVARRVLFKSVNAKLLGPDVNCIILGGSHTPREHMRNIAALGYYTISGFGMTETALTSCETGMNLHTRTSGSVGRPFASVEYKVESDGKRSNTGEMLIRGSSVHTGQLKDGQLIAADLDAQGWYRTGDIVRLEKGMRMYVEGRSKDVIINESGENVYPDELEDYFGNLEGVEQFSVLGLRNTGASRVNKIRRRRHLHPDYEDITLVLNVGERYRDDAHLTQVMRQVAAINRRLPVLKQVTRVLATHEPFEMANGIKVKRMALKKSLEERRVAYRDLDLKSGALPPGDTQPIVVEEAVPEAEGPLDIKDKVRKLYAEALGTTPDQVQDDAHFINDLGGDSLQVLSVSLKVEELFSVLIPTEEYGQCTTVNDLAAIINQRLGGETAKAEEPRGAVAPVTDFEQSEEYKAFEVRVQGLVGSGMENPYFVAHDSALKDTSVMEGQEVLNFGSYNYVCMSGRREVMDAAKDAIEKYGTSASGSRLLAGEKSLNRELEAEIAAWKNAEAALVLVSGHATNVTLVGNFCGKDDLIVYDALAHNSIDQGVKLSQAVAKPFPHNDHTALESILRTQRDKFKKVLIIVEGAYSMDGDIANVPAFVALKKKYGCFLLVDEAHSACVIGEHGGGVDEYFHLDRDDVDIKMGTLSKGLGTCGGYLAGKRSLIEYLRYNLPGFVFSVGISPPLAAATLAAVRLLRADTSIVKQLEGNIDTFVREAHKRRLNTCLAGHTAIIPILVGSDENAFLLSNMLRHKGVFVPPAVFPAVPKGRARLRFCVVSEHREEQIVQALDALVEAAQEAGVTLPD